MKIGIINSGGDVPGINAVIASAVKYGSTKGYEFIGFNKGWEGLLDNNFRVLNPSAVRGISHLGGTILHSVNKGRFAGKAGAGDPNKIPDEILELAKSNVQKLGIDALMVIGGDGTLSGAIQLMEKGVNMVGVPKTIDNDLNDVDQTFGFSTAVNIIKEAMDRIHTTAVSHDRVFFIETMGRHAGWIALYAGLAGGADAILIPEFSFNYDKLINYFRHRKQVGSTYSIVVVAEGATGMSEGLSLLNNTEGRPELRLGGISYHIMDKIDQLAPGEFDMRNVILGHIQRGGTPSAEDKILSANYGTSAIDLIANNQFGYMVSIKGNEIKSVPISEAIGQLKLVTENSTVYQTAKKIGVYFGD